MVIYSLNTIVLQSKTESGLNNSLTIILIEEQIIEFYKKKDNKR